MSYGYTEDQFVEQHTIGRFPALGWQTVSAMEETVGPGGTLSPEARHRGRARHRAAARILPGVVPTGMLGDVRARLRELPRAECRGVRHRYLGAQSQFPGAGATVRSPAHANPGCAGRGSRAMRTWEAFGCG